MKTVSLSLAATLALSTAAAAATLDTSVGYGLSADGMSITIFGDLSSSDASETIMLDAPVSAIAYRPVTGELYGYVAGADGDDVVTINVATGEVTSVGATFAVNATMNPTTQVGFDFNNQIDAARAVSMEDNNHVFFPDDFTAEARRNTVDRFTDLFYEGGDVNQGTNPGIFANAYTNAIDGMKAPSTLQYTIDAKTESLSTLANNAGTLSTVGMLGFDVGMFGGFDIVSMGVGDDLGIALLFDEDMMMSGLYEIDLSTGLASLIGNVDGSFRSFAAQVDPQLNAAPIPLPASVLLLMGAIGGLGAMRRLRG